MKLKSARLILPIILLWSCSSEKEADLKPDCSTSDFALSISATTAANCDQPGGITATSTGGTGAISYTIDGSTFNSDGVFSNVSAGTYTVTGEDESGCTSSVQAIVASEDGGVELTVVSSSETGCGTNNGSVEVSATGGAGNYQYAVDDGSTQSSSTFSGLTSGTHVISAVDENGCSTTTSVTLLTGTKLEGNIMPIISANCATSSSCHASGASGSRPDFSSKANIIGNANRIKARTGAGTMPPSGTLPQAQIDLIACWVDDGAADN